MPMLQRLRWQVREASAVRNGTGTKANMFRELGQYDANFAILRTPLARPHIADIMIGSLVAQNHAQ